MIMTERKYLHTDTWLHIHFYPAKKRRKKNLLILKSVSHFHNRDIKDFVITHTNTHTLNLPLLDQYFQFHYSPVFFLSISHLHTPHTHTSSVKRPHQHVERGKAQDVWTIPLPAGATSVAINVSTARGYVCTSMHLCACVSSHLHWHAHRSLTETHPACIINLPSDTQLSTHWSASKCSSRGFDQAMGGTVWHPRGRGLDKHKDKKTEEKVVYWDIVQTWARTNRI